MVLPYADDDAVDLCPDCEQPLGQLGLCQECQKTGANMLSLTRYPGQKIIVTHEPTGDKITIEVAAVNHPSKQVRSLSVCVSQSVFLLLSVDVSVSECVSVSFCLSVCV